MLGLYQERYEGFPARHFHEQRQKPYNYKLDYTVTRLALQRAGLMRPMVGMMLSLPSRKRGTPRALPGCRAMTGNPIWWSPSRMRPARSIRV